MSVLQKGLSIVFGSIGSVFIQRAADGKLDVALGPWLVICTGGMLIGCAVQDAETFSQCVVTIGSYLMGT